MPKALHPALSAQRGLPSEAFEQISCGSLCPVQVVEPVLLQDRCDLCLCDPTEPHPRINDLLACCRSTVAVSEPELPAERAIRFDLCVQRGHSGIYRLERTGAG